MVNTYSYFESPDWDKSKGSVVVALKDRFYKIKDELHEVLNLNITCMESLSDICRLLDLIAKDEEGMSIDLINYDEGSSFAKVHIFIDNVGTIEAVYRW